MFRTELVKKISVLTKLLLFNFKKNLTKCFWVLSINAKGWLLHLIITGILMCKSISIPELLNYLKVWFNSSLYSWSLKGCVKSRLSLHKGKVTLVQYKGYTSSCHFPSLCSRPTDILCFFSMGLNQLLIRDHFLWKMMLERHQLMQSLKSQSKMITCNQKSSRKVLENMPPQTRIASDSVT